MGSLDRDGLVVPAGQVAAPERITVIGVEPVRLDLGLSLSPAVAARLPEVLALIHAELAAR